MKLPRLATQVLHDFSFVLFYSKTGVAKRGNFIVRRQDHYLFIIS